MDRLAFHVFRIASASVSAPARNVRVTLPMPARKGSQAWLAVSTDQAFSTSIPATISTMAMLRASSMLTMPARTTIANNPSSRGSINGAIPRRQAGYSTGFRSSP